MKCKECKHCNLYQRRGNTTKEVTCEHPNWQYIDNYFKTHGIRKFVGLIGFVNSKGVFPIKTSPAWCPLKEEKDGAEE